MIDNFNELKELNAGNSVFLTEEQKQWVKLQKMMVHIKPRLSQERPSNAIRMLCYDLAYNQVRGH